MTAPSRALRIVTWVVSALLFALFTLAASPPKLTGDPEAIARFAHFGYSDAFRLFIGASEFLGGIALLIPRLAFWSACGLTLIMLGAVASHLAVGDAAHGGPALVALVLCVVVAVLRRGQALLLS